MLYNLALPYSDQLHIANLFTYITFRSGLGMMISLILCLSIGSKLIKYLKLVQKNGQPIRTNGPKTHFEKAGTPTMGGIMIILSSVITTLLLSDINNIYVWVCIFIFVSFGVLGFIDDYTKVIKSNHFGLSPKCKMLIQIIISFISVLLIEYYANSKSFTILTFPFLKKIFIDLGYFYYILAIIVITGASNAVNLTDGLDGLAIGTILIAITPFGIITYLVGNIIHSNYLQIAHIPNTGELLIFCSCLIGSGLGFLWYNAKPAEIFMGDTGSLALGGVLGAISIITKHEILLVIIGGVFVFETMSVIIQVCYYKYTGGKRFFLMAPIHHHFEKKGWKESKVVVRFWIIAIIFAIIGLSSLKLR